MDLVLNEEQEMLARSAREFVSGRSSLRRVRQLRDGEDADGFSRDLWREMAALGWLGITVPEEFGGAGLGWTDQMVVLEEMGRGLMPEPFTSTVLLGATALLLGGSAAQKEEHLPAIAGGARLVAVAYQEAGSRYDASKVATGAVKSATGFTITGEKIQVLDGHVADHLVVSARTSGASGDVNGITLLLVPADTPGVTIARQSRIDGRNAALVRFDGVEIGADAALGEVGGGGALLGRVLDRARIGLSAEMLGSMRAAFEMTNDYLKTRIQFGVPIGSFQALKHRAAKMYIELELSRSAVMGAHRALDERRDDATIAKLASLAKARCSDAFVLIGNECVQMHGGIGVTDEHDIGLFFKRARVAEATFGDAAFHRDRSACLEGY
ncbi:MAG: acyl-CoA dehydrogenase family protein [Deltaproteobacteria bacterium]|nr:acyl-CoA dehydrogenase family protein [Deltaproteobacteria bacterium]